MLMYPGSVLRSATVAPSVRPSVRPFRGGSRGNLIWRSETAGRAPRGAPPPVDKVLTWHVATQPRDPRQRGAVDSGDRSAASADVISLTSLMLRHQ